MIQRYREIREQRKQGEIEVGFTLIELLIVIVVLGILAAIVVFSLQGVTGQSKQAACISDAKTVEIAVSAFNAENGSTTLMDQASLTSTIAAETGSPYLHSWPGSSIYAITIDSTGNVFVAPGGAGTVNYDSEVSGATPTGCFVLK